MDEFAVLDELLNKALAEEQIEQAQKDFYLLEYRKQKMTLAQIREALAKLPKVKGAPQIYGNYILKRCLGRGGMGEVFEAYHRETGKRYALKRIRPAHKMMPEDQEKIRLRFLREYSLQVKLDHPHIVKVQEFGMHGQELFLVTQFIDGDTLLNIIKRELLAPENYYRKVMADLVTRMIHICDAIQYAHISGIIHRDINPKNIMLDREENIWIMDFGLAKRLGDEVMKLTKTTELVGTPSYMSPEQWRNINIGPASDIYALGATLYYVITGFPPQPEDPMVAACNILNEIPPTPTYSYNPLIPDSLEPIVTNAMAYRVENRCPDAATLSKMLDDWQQKWNRRSVSRRIYAGCMQILDSLKTKEETRPKKDDG